MIWQRIGILVEDVFEKNLHDETRQEKGKKEGGRRKEEEGKGVVGEDVRRWEGEKVMDLAGSFFMISNV